MRASDHGGEDGFASSLVLGFKGSYQSASNVPPSLLMPTDLALTLPATGTPCLVDRLAGSSLLRSTILCPCSVEVLDHQHDTRCRLSDAVCPASNLFQGCPFVQFGRCEHVRDNG